MKIGADLVGVIYVDNRLSEGEFDGSIRKFWKVSPIRRP
jgi:hypothetical protein